MNTKKIQETITYDSSVVLQSRYNFQTKTLQLEFKNGVWYEYENVDPEDYSNFSTSESIGSACVKYIRQYTYKKIEP
jgi:hypothetical protein